MDRGFFLTLQAMRRCQRKVKTSAFLQSENFRF